MSWDFINITMPVAAKEHRCAECGGTILKGERHSYTSGKCEGDLTTYRLCLLCHRLAQAYCREINDEGWGLGTLRADLAEEGITDLAAWLAASEEAAAERNRQTARWRERVAAMRDTVICDRCGATVATYADACRAALADPCPGFRAIERAATEPAQ